MAVARDLNEYRRIQEKRIAKMKQWQRRGPISSAKFMALQLRRMAPRGNFGRVIKSIHRRRNKVEVGGVSSRGFPYIHWINATPGSGLEVLRYPKGAWIPPEESRQGTWVMIAPPGTTAIYGQTPGWNWTGQPGFFWIAQDLTRQFGVDAMLRMTRNALRAGF